MNFGKVNQQQSSTSKFLIVHVLLEEMMITWVSLILELMKGSFLSTPRRVRRLNVTTKGYIKLLKVLMLKFMKSLTFLVRMWIVISEEKA